MKRKSPFQHELKCPSQWNPLTPYNSHTSMNIEIIVSVDVYRARSESKQRIMYWIILLYRGLSTKASDFSYLVLFRYIIIFRFKNLFAVKRWNLLFLDHLLAYFLIIYLIMWEMYFLLFNRNKTYILYICFAALLFTAAMFTHIVWPKHNKAPITN